LPSDFSLLTPKVRKVTTATPITADTKAAQDYLASQIKAPMQPQHLACKNQKGFCRFKLGRITNKGRTIANSKPPFTHTWN